MQYDFIKTEHRLRKELDEDRYQHTLGVMFTASSLAMCHGADIQKAECAGLLHCQEYGIEVSKTEMKAQYLLHSKLGAYLAKEQYGVTDEDVLSAIRWHTTGRPNMSVLEKIIFIADYIEPARYKAANLSTIRALAFRDLNQTVLRILEDTLHYLDKGHGEIDEMSRSAFRYYYNLFNEPDDKGDSLTV